jgi:sugar (pentulose or hexulose) kinase
MLSGGILRSAKWTRMLADILEWTLYCSPNEQMSLIGGAALALYAAGALERLSDFAAEHGVPVVPDPKKADTYRRRFEEYLCRYRSN